MSTNSTMTSLLCSSQQYLLAAAIIILPNVGGMLGGLITAKEVKGPWFINLKKPFFNPPNWLFAPVWTTIYTCMGISSYLIYRQGGFGAASLPLVLYGTQLLLNWIWAPIFFYFHRIDFALVDIVALWFIITATAAVFYPISHIAAYLLLPHLAWISFATILNLSLYILNGNGNKIEQVKEKKPLDN